MYRSRLGGDLGGMVLGYVSSMGEDSAIVHYDILGSEAHTLMLYKQGIISEGDARKILAALEGLKGRDLGPGEGSGEASGEEDIHELVESLVIKEAGLESGGRMHTARSRNDQVSLDMRMKVRDDILWICGALLDLVEVLVSVAKAHQRTAMPLYTHMQQAQAGLFSHYLLAQADSLFRDYERMAGALYRVNQSPLGAGPAGGTSLSIDRGMVAKMLGFDGVVENSLDAASSRDFVAEYVGACAILMAGLSRMAEDFVVWSTAEFGFLELADEFASPSSVMPQKKNPDILELCRGKAAMVIGNMAAVLATTKGLATGYGRDLQQLKAAAWSASDVTHGTLLVLKSMLLTVRVDDKRMKKAAESGNLVALDIAEKMVEEGVAFRVTHQVAGRLAQLAAGLKKPIGKLGEGEVAEAVSGTGVDAGMVAGIISSVTVTSSLKARKSQGSAGYSEQRKMITSRTKRVNKARLELDARGNKVAAAVRELERQVQEMIK